MDEPVFSGWLRMKRQKPVPRWPRDKRRRQPASYSLEPLRGWHVVGRSPLSLHVGSQGTLWDPEAGVYLDSLDLEPDWMPYW